MADITITEEEFQKIQNDLLLLECLKACDVVNWVGYDRAKELLKERLEHGMYSQLFPYNQIDCGVVVISREEFDSLRQSSDFLACLENAGVDNWEWYYEAVAMYNEGEEESK